MATRMKIWKIRRLNRDCRKSCVSDKVGQCLLPGKGTLSRSYAVRLWRPAQGASSNMQYICSAEICNVESLNIFVFQDNSGTLSMKYSVHSIIRKSDLTLNACPYSGLVIDRVLHPLPSPPAIFGWMSMFFRVSLQGLLILSSNVQSLFHMTEWPG